MPFNVEQSFSHDGIGRTRSISLGENLSKDIYYAKYGDHATNRINSIWFGVNGIRKDNTKYTYDKAGNIATVTENGKLVARYFYDGLNKLVRQDDLNFGTVTYKYDHTGNITYKTTYALTFDETLGTPVETQEYTYRQRGWQDQLVNLNGQSFEYDAVGNPTLYCGKAMTWQGRDDCDSILWNFLLEAWKKSISIGEKNYKYSQIVNFIIGYTLYFDWIMLLDKEPACNQILMRAISLEPTSLLAEFITLFIKNSATHKYSQKFCSLFAKQSLLDNYFRSLYCNDK